MNNGSMKRDRTILEKTVQVPSHNSAGRSTIKRFILLGCEDHAPYGPTDKTACLFLDLLCRGLTLSRSSITPTPTGEVMEYVTFRLCVWRVKEGEYPTEEEWEKSDGVLIPGSFSAAYDEEPWIIRLKQVIRTHIMLPRRKTLGVCFGHQIMAHAVEGGLAVKCPSGHQAGPHTLHLTPTGQRLLHRNNTVDLLYTHGDMIESLPSMAISLGGNKAVPIQAAAYFATPTEARAYYQEAAPTAGVDNTTIIQPHAITFQAHPEYTANQSLGIDQTFCSILTALGDRGVVPDSVLEKARQDANDNFLSLERTSLDMIVAVGQAFGWY